MATRTPAFDEMVSFAVEQLGLQPSSSSPEVTSFSLPNGDTFEVYRSEEAGGGHPAEGAIGAFLVDDAAEAHAELQDAGAEVLPLHVEGAFKWCYVRAPDGSFYELYSTTS